MFYEKFITAHFGGKISQKRPLGFYPKMSYFISQKF